MSCLRLAPSWRWASGIVSRRRQSASRCDSDAAVTASATVPALASRRRAQPRSGRRIPRRRLQARPRRATYHCVRRVERVARARRRGGQTNSSAMRGTSLEGRDRIAERLAQPGRAARARRRATRGATKAVAVAAGRGNSRRRCRRHDAERAFGADEELLQVVAGVVLAQRRQLVEHAPVRQHDLEAEHERAHHAVAQHRRAAGIGRDDAAERRAALGSERHRQQAIDGGGGGLQLGQHAAGLGGQRIARSGSTARILRMRRSDRRISLPAGARRRAAAVARVAALRHERDPLARAMADKLRHARGRIGQGDQGRTAPVNAAKIGFEGRAIGG